MTVKIVATVAAVIGAICSAVSFFTEDKLRAEEIDKAVAKHLKK